MAARRQRYSWRSEAALLSLFAMAIVLALLLGRWLAVIQEPPTRHAVGLRLLAGGRADEAAYLFEEPLWRGVALYRSGRYHRAVGEFVTDDSVTGYYNMGNAYAHLRLYEGAIAAYEVVLSRVPDHEDARYNLDLVREAAQREQELEEASRDETETDGDLADGLHQEQQEAGGEPDPSAASEEEPSSSESASDEAGEGERTEASNAPPSSNGASGSEQEGDRAEASSFTLTASEQRGETGKAPRADELEDKPVLPGDVDRLSEEALADDILLRRIEDSPALVLKARLTMALRKQEARR
jgi:Ca-activated chloride channel family protein